MKKGLVFCGGGAKGSYEAGVWKYLDEHGIKFDIVTGTSIGGLNAAMYAQHDFDRDIELWNKITIDLIVEDSFKYDEKKSIKVTLKENDNLIGFLKNYISNRGGNVSPFKELVDEYIDPEKIINSDVICGIVTAKFPSMQGVEVVLKEKTPAKIKKFLIATASAFPVFQVCKIDKESYVDGGYYDNLPINFAIELGAEDIVAVDLNPNITHKEFLNKSYIKYIHPRWNLGGFLKFEREAINKNLMLGYMDAQKAYGELFGFKYAFNKIDTIKSREFVLMVSKVVGYMQKNKIKSNVKPEIEGDIFHILEKSVYRPLSDDEYYIRAVEVAAEFFNVDYYKKYDLHQMFQIIESEISMLDFNPNLYNGYLRLKSINKQKDFVSRMDDKFLIKDLFNRELELPIEELAIICASKPIIFIIYMIMKLRR